MQALCAAAVRALTGQGDLHYKGRRLYRGRTPLPHWAPHLHPSPETDDFESFRGAVDGVALRLTRSDANLHRSLSPDAPLARLLFDLLEQYRVESLVDDVMPGMAHNLRHRHEQWSLAFHRARLTDTATGLLLYTVAQTCRARVSGQPVMEETQDLIEATRGALGPRMGHALDGLRRHRADQAAYAEHALAIARTVGEMLREAAEEAGDASDTPDDDPQRAAFNLLMPVDPPEAADGSAPVVAGSSRVLADAGGEYRVFTTAYDRELAAAPLVRPEVLESYRAQMDRRMAAQGINLARLARELKAALGVPAHDGWDSGQEAGRVDGRRLAQLISSPTQRHLFRLERQELTPDCVVSFLIDCSGSMKAHVESVALLVDVLARALESAGAASEVLGFTTGAWNGGRAARDWKRAGRPAHPGRLNELSHLVFKDADTAWRRGRHGIAALLKADLFREGVDGEALQWACARLMARPEARRILVVVSDGCPQDAATTLANDVHYLDHHLQDVVSRCEQAGAIEVCALGVGLDLSPYYRRSQALDLAAFGANEVLREIVRLMAGRGRRR